MCLGGCEHIEHHLGILKRYYYFFGLYKEPVKANEVSLSLKTIYCISCQQKDESPIDEKKRPSKILFHTSQGSGTITIVTIWVKKIVDLIFPNCSFGLCLRCLVFIIYELKCYYRYQKCTICGYIHST